MAVSECCALIGVRLLGVRLEIGSEASEEDAIGCDHVGGIHALPAAILQPHFAPRVRIGLADNHVFAQRIEFPAVVTEHDPRGNAGDAHERGKSRGIVLTEPLPALEEKLLEADGEVAVGAPGWRE